MMTEDQQFKAAAARAKVRIGEKMRDVWWSLLLRGLLAAVLGIAALIWPNATLDLLIRLIGIFVLFVGIASLLGAFRIRELGAHLIPGLISVAVGAVLLFWPDITGRLLLMIVGLWALFQGVVLFLAGREADQNDPERSLVVSTGVAAAIAGGILIVWPGTGAVAISWIIGILALLIGVSLIFLALRLRRMTKRVSVP